MNFRFSQLRESLQQRFRRCAKIGSPAPVILEMLPIVSGYKSDLHISRLFETRDCDRLAGSPGIWSDQSLQLTLTVRYGRETRTWLDDISA